MESVPREGSMTSGHPVLWQVGSSDRGRDFAAKHAEAIFAILPTINTMKQYSQDLNARLDEPMQDIYVPGIEELFKSVINSRTAPPSPSGRSPSTTIVQQALI